MRINDRCCRPGWAGHGKRAPKKIKEAFFGDMNGKDVTSNNEVYGEGIVGMDSQSEIMKYRQSTAGGKSRGT